MDSMALYQGMARRTQSDEMTDDEKLYHAVFGLCSEAGEVAGILQKKYQGHPVKKEHIMKELGDFLWMIAEACDVLNLDMGYVAEQNIVKLRMRYPDGFDAAHSLHRGEGDI